jgi:hypothetical protein
MRKDNSLIKVPAIFLWAVGYEALLSGNHEKYDRILKIFSTNLSKLDSGNKFIQTINKFQGNFVIPFKRDLLDQYLAALVFQEGVRGGFKLKSDYSFVETGFFRINSFNSNHEKIEYVDTISQVIRGDGKLPEFLNESSKVDLIKLLYKLSNESLELHTSDGKHGTLKITGNFSLFTHSLESSKCSLSLWVSPTNENKASLSRSLGNAKLYLGSLNEIYLTDIKTENVMEMTAASQIGRWLLIESDLIKVFGKLPDLTDDFSKSNAHIDLSNAFNQFVFQMKPFLYLDKAIVLRFSKNNKWFVPYDSLTWLESIA